MRLRGLILLALCLVGPGARAGERSDPKNPATLSSKAAIGPGSDGREAIDSPQFTLREEAALKFLKEFEPDMAVLIEPLKSMKLLQYQRAIQDIYQVSQNLARLKQNDPRRYEVGLDAWKTKARVEVLTARLADNPSADLEGKLREAVDKEYDANLNRQKLERELVRAQLKRLDETVERLDKNRAKNIENKYQLLFRKSQEAGNFSPEARTSAPMPRKKGKDQK